MSRITDFLAYLDEHVGDAYVWGAQGQNLTEMSPAELETFVERRETSDTNIDRALRYIYRAPKKPLYAFDCSGLIMYWFQQVKGWSGDESSRGLYSRCAKIERDGLKPGDLVFRHNGDRIHHVGVYVGNGQVIEAKGRDDGVVKRDISASGTGYWNRFGRHPLMQVDEPAEPVKPAEPAKGKVITQESPYMRGDDIKALQAALNGLGYDCGKADGIAGANTLKGIRAFVEAHKEV